MTTPAKFVALLLAGVVGLAAVTSAKKPHEDPPPVVASGTGGLADTVVLIIRHAEKPASGFGLTPEGEARARAYEAVDRIRWPEGFCRRDIGWQEIAREGGVSSGESPKGA